MGDQRVRRDGGDAPVPETQRKPRRLETLLLRTSCPIGFLHRHVATGTPADLGDAQTARRLFPEARGRRRRRCRRSHGRRRHDDRSPTPPPCPPSTIGVTSVFHQATVITSPLSLFRASCIAVSHPWRLSRPPPAEQTVASLPPPPPLQPPPPPPRLRLPLCLPLA